MRISGSFIPRAAASGFDSGRISRCAYAQITREFPANILPDRIRPAARHACARPDVLGIPEMWSWLPVHQDLSRGSNRHVLQDPRVRSGTEREGGPDFLPYAELSGALHETGSLQLAAENQSLRDQVRNEKRAGRVRKAGAMPVDSADSRLHIHGAIQEEVAFFASSVFTFPSGTRAPTTISVSQFMSTVV